LKARAAAVAIGVLLALLFTAVPASAEVFDYHTNVFDYHGKQPV